MRVSALYVYPVKACQAVALEEATLGPLGLEHDRHYAFVQADGRALTQRDQPLLATVRPRIDAGVLRLDFGGLFSLRFAKAEFTEPVGVDVWSKRVAARTVAEAAVAKAIDYLGAPVRLAMLDRDAQRAFVDSQPVLATTTASLARLNAELGSSVGMERFRPNIVLEGIGEWRQLRGCDADLEYVKPCGRCEVTTIDQTSGARRGPEPLRTLSERFGGDFGLYYRVTRTGRVQRGEVLQGA